MIKKFLYIFITISLIFSFGFKSYSFEYSEELMENIDDKTKEYLCELGIDEISFEEIFELTPTRVFKFIFSLITEKSVSLVNRFILIFTTLLISALANAFIKENSQLNKIIDYISIVIILSFTMESIGRILTDVAISIRTTKIFINAYLPIMAGIIVASRNPSLAVTYNSFSIIFSNIIGFFADKVFMPVISVLFSFNIISSFSSDNFHLRINKTLRKLVIVVLALFSTIFTGLLTSQSILASSSDTFMLKGIKFISGTFIPVVGGTVSEAISSVISSFLIMKSTLGVLIIIVILLINLPVMIELLVWYFFLSLCSAISSLLKTDSITDVFDGLSSTVSLMNIILFFITFVLVISTGIILLMGK